MGWTQISKFKMQKLTREIEETKNFIEFLERTRRSEAIDKYEETPNCVHVLEDFSAIATENHHETLEHLNEISKEYKRFREHALGCERCQLSLEALFLFKGYENLRLFPEKIQKILNREWIYNDADYDKKKGIYICKLPAPSSGTFGPTNSRLVYITRWPIQKAIEEFAERIEKPLELKGLSGFHIRAKKSNLGKGTPYFQSDTNHKNPHYHTYISIRSKTK